MSAILGGVLGSFPPGAGSAAPAAHASTHISGGGDPFTSAQVLEAIVKRLQESSGPTTLALGAIADGEYFKRSGATAIGGTAASIVTAALGGSLKLVEAKLVTANTQTVTFSGLNGDADERYYLDLQILNNGAAVARYEVRPNGLTTLQYGQQLDAQSTSVVAGTRPDWVLTDDAVIGGEMVARCWISACKTYNAIARVRTILSFAATEITADSAMRLTMRSGVWNETATNLTSLDVRATVAAGIGNGSTLTLYKIARA